MSMFAELANVKAKDVVPPVLIPTGHYQAQFSGLMKEHKAQSGNVAMRFPFKVLAPGEDVDQEALAEAGGIPDKEYTIDFWMSPEARYRFTDFGKAMGVSDDLNLLQMAEALGTSGEPFLIEVKHSPDSRDPSKVYLRFDNPAPLA